ncbi:VanZ family protein [Cytobacillus sp. IB215665]|uniref:VanZ family protein n=1 Tax=Cytobacillus sp. IB215665 TaxID=3097357 RepID=UPI002A0F539A|nr:VanZ family protein [Cytobacillus sp. IB215665]MDX8365741.1 VanZ family protein [Cytobacillus sp. IB215665]
MSDTIHLTKDKKMILGWLLFGIYFLMLIYVMFFGFSRSSYEEASYNLIPFKTIANYVNSIGYYNTSVIMINLIGNVIVFIPFGLFLSLLIPNLRKSSLLILVFIWLIGSLELLQYVFSLGSLDIDDILLNTVGAWLGLKVFLTVRMALKN